MDPDVVAELLTRHARDARDAPVARLTGRERDVPALMADGRPNIAIAQQLFVLDKAVSKHCTSIFAKLDLTPSETGNCRVLAVLAFLNS